MKTVFLCCLAVLGQIAMLGAQVRNPQLNGYDVVWDKQSKNSSESMPCGGGDIGLNVWVEDNEIFAYIARSGTFDENNSLLKLGRMRIKLSPNPFDGPIFRQTLLLKEGAVEIIGKRNSISTSVKIWVDVFRPIIHADIQSSIKTTAEVSFESWRHQDRIVQKRENHQNSYKFSPQGEVITYRDSIAYSNNGVFFYHANRPVSIFDVVVKQQQLDAVKTELYNPLKNLVFGGMLYGNGMVPAGTSTGAYQGTEFKAWKLKSRTPLQSQTVKIELNTAIVNDAADWQKKWKNGLVIRSDKTDHERTLEWWNTFWERSFICVDPDKKAADSPEWQSGRNYQLTRYMQACNSTGQWPIKHNGGLFTVDPVFTNPELNFTPDFRNWGGGTHTAQNQRLVYWPMLKSGDYDLMKPQFDFYLRLLKNAELRTKTYWGHEGACFTEQMENFGLPNPAEYSWKRPVNFDPGLEYNAWLEYEWDTVLEFCMMMLETGRYNEDDVKDYLPFIESCVTFFDQHYQYLAKQRGNKALDADGKLILYPGSGAETYKMAYNSVSTIAALKTVLGRLLVLPSIAPAQRTSWQAMLSRVPEISFREFNGRPTIAPAKLWQRVNNTESTQLYPVFPWGIYGIGKPGLDTAINTYKYDPDAVKFRGYLSWKQDNIFAARLGLTEDAAQLTVAKLKDSERRFPAFWGPGYDWVPDQNWGGSGMIGLQEMLLQTDGKRIMLFPAWPKAWDVHFKLHAPYQTTVEATLKDGKMVDLKVFPESRRSDVEVMLLR